MLGPFEHNLFVAWEATVYIVDLYRVVSSTFSFAWFYNHYVEYQALEEKTGSCIVTHLYFFFRLYISFVCTEDGKE